jgi:oxygen-independent coproporphyrinogen-3 oxidase
VLRAGSIARIIEEAGRAFDIVEDAEITLEANPGTVNRSKLLRLRKAGVNRISIGVQSLDNVMLKRLGRIHDSAEARRAVECAREAGFGNISVDMIYGKPGESAGSWLEELSKAVSLRPDHVSAYCLTIEEGTPFGRAHGKRRLELPSEDEQAKMCENGQAFLEASGLRRYEVSNFARPGFQSRHNLGYWKRRPCIGFGTAAHSYVPNAGEFSVGTPAPQPGRHGVRFWNHKSVVKYKGMISKGAGSMEGMEMLDAKKALVEEIFLGLRLREGLDFGKIAKTYGIDTARIEEEIEMLVSKSIVEKAGRRVRITPAGLFLTDEITARLLIHVPS